MTGLHVDSVIKSFDTRQVLTDIFISCDKGDIIGLLGRNGSGKSTLLKIIFGSLQAERKFVKVEGKIVSGTFNNHKFINYLPQHNFLPDHISVNRIIDVFCCKSSVLLIKKHYLIDPFLKRRYRELSGGEKRILEIFLIIYSNSKYTLIDEPFNGIAPVYKDEIKRIITEQSRYKGFIITDHDYRNVLDVATRIILMHDGGTKEVKSKEDLVNWGYITKAV
ncbi:MAG TPA: ATP-binding cassette domain-containing protein [Tenuifilaceae bacterium]|nr:ATP-binding cassette domain-containing protein [Tenuifilaceae bacterium]HPI43793.1 ATP-binding cassette domain-containing protein [Tenuifilaceae bacterium]HPN20957.1 ATP-binding cassette domain-containing protein [Tenuifilaceae bacterium]HPV56982.1 ATP-binding cassette domain-containing protein [Tenuifilaceae bacterium]